MGELKDDEFGNALNQDVAKTATAETPATGSEETATQSVENPQITETKKVFALSKWERDGIGKPYPLLLSEDKESWVTLPEKAFKTESAEELESVVKSLPSGYFYQPQMFFINA